MLSRTAEIGKSRTRFVHPKSDQDIVATFHTHPNTGSDYLQEPSETDKRAVRNDPHMKGACYEGEFVISAQTIYRIEPTGQVSEIAQTKDYFAEG